MNLPRYILLETILILIISCSGGDEEGGSVPPLEAVKTPLSATLIFPHNNETCFEGAVISGTESIVGFKWSAAENTDTYTLNITNLDSNVLQKVEVSNNEKEVAILRGTPYSWYVTSKSNKTSQTAQSSLWKFYNAGANLENYAPFPAEVINPRMGSSIQPGNIQFKWIATDVDNDIINYDIYLDTTSPPLTFIATQEATTINIDLLPDKVYYWRVITRDQAANTSKSQVFEFKTQ